MKPTSTTASADKSLNKITQDYSERPPRRRRQLTPKPVQVGNPFDKLQGLVGRALKG